MGLAVSAILYLILVGAIAAAVFALYWSWVNDRVDGEDERGPTKGFFAMRETPALEKQAAEEAQVARKTAPYRPKTHVPVSLNPSPSGPGPAPTPTPHAKPLDASKPDSADPRPKT